jgi:hypothetical protein
MAKVCPECKTENQEDAKFCQNCGEKLLDNTVLIDGVDVGVTEEDFSKFLTLLQNGDITIFSYEPSPIILKKNENISIIMNDISLHELKAVNETLGVSFFLIKAKSKLNDKIQKMDQGSLILTNKRLIFLGSKGTRNIDFRTILAIKSAKEGIEIQSENQQTKYFVGTDKTKISVSIGNRQITIPVLGGILQVAIQGFMAKID